MASRQADPRTLDGDECERPGEAQAEKRITAPSLNVEPHFELVQTGERRTPCHRTILHLLKERRPLAAGFLK